MTVVCYQSVAGPGRQPANAAAATILRRRRTINTDNRAAETRVTSVSLAYATDIIALQRRPSVPLHALRSLHFVYSLELPCSSLQSVP